MIPLRATEDEPVSSLATPVPERIHKVLANAGLGSRRAIERWVAEGRITIDGRVAKLGDQVKGRERVCVDGRPRLTAAAGARAARPLLAYYKTGATRGDAEDEAALDVASAAARPLDRRGRARSNTSGLSVLTTDGELAFRLMHPATVIERLYAVRLLGEPSAAQLRQLAEGVELDKGIARSRRSKRQAAAATTSGTT